MFTVDHGLNGNVPNMYDLKRLKFRLRTLRDIVLPSVNSQTYLDLEHRIFYSENIPTEIQNSLSQLPMPRSKLIKLKRGRDEFFKHARTNDDKCIHIVLDDDDSLAPWFVDMIVESCKNETGETIITYLNGIVVNWEEEETENELKVFSIGSKMNYPMINLGLSILTFSGRGTHELGNHTKITQYYPDIKILKIANEDKIGWIRTESNNSHHKTYHPQTLIKTPYIKEKSILEVYSEEL